MIEKAGKEFNVSQIEASFAMHPEDTLPVCDGKTCWVCWPVVARPYFYEKFISRLQAWNPEIRASKTKVTITVPYSTLLF